MIEFLMTPNPQLINIFMIPMYILDSFLTMLIFTTVLDVTVNKKRKLFYVVGISIIGIAEKMIIPEPYSNFLSLIIIFVGMYFILNMSLVKSIISLVSTLFLTATIETFITTLFVKFLNVSYSQIYEIPIYRMALLIILYSIIAILYLVIKKSHFNIKFLENMSKRTRNLLLLNLLIGLLAIASQFFLLTYYQLDLPIGIAIVSIITLLAYFIISLYSIVNAAKLQKTTQDLQEMQSYNKTLTILHDNIRTFKHDFNNIVNAIGGYVYMKDMDGLKSYYATLVENCHRVNNLTSLNPGVINNPPIYGILTDKYYTADSLGIKINLEIFMDLNTINMKVYEFTKVLGILMDNAIEASSECEKKIINVMIRQDADNNRQLLVVENTYCNKNIDLNSIYEKAYTTKENNSGIGLWDVRNNIVKKNKNLNLHTTKDDEYFVQQLEIYIK